MAIVAAKCTLEQTGTAVALSAEATTMLSGNRYQITNTAKRVLDPTSGSFVVTDNGTPLAAADTSINWLHGVIYKVSGSFTGPVTIDGHYLPRHAFAEVKAFEFTLTTELKDVTTMGASTAAHARIKSLLDAKGSLQGFDNLQTDLDSGGTTIKPFTDFTAGTRRVLSILFDDGYSFRAFIKFSNVKENAEVMDILNATLDWELDAVRGTVNTLLSTNGGGACWSYDA